MRKFNFTIETERLFIRPFTVDDIDAAYQMNLDEKVNKYTGDGGIVSREEIERRIIEHVLGDYQKYGFGRLAVELKKDKTFIGFAGLKYLEDMHEVDLGYRFISQYWGKGYATESARACLKLGFNKLELEKIIAMVLPVNTASIHVLEKLQFNFDRDIIEDNEVAKLYSLDKKKFVLGH